MHKIQIEWNSIRHSLMGLEWAAERSPVPLWVLYWVWMQCTSSWLFQKKCNSPPSLSLNSHVRSRKLTPIITRDVSHLWGEARLQTLQNVGVGERSEGRRGEVWRVRTGSWRHLSLPETERCAKLATYHLFSTLQPEPKHQFVSIEVGLNLIINKWCLAQVSEVSIFREMDI